MISVAVAVLTYRRPEYLIRLVEHLGMLKRDEHFRITVIVVDNDDTDSSRPIFETRQWRFREGYYFHEPRRGIPIARNRAVREALDLDADLLCFIDDDEFPHPNWLVELVGTYRRTQCQLIGGPVRVACPERPLTNWQALIHAGLVRRAVHKERSIARAVRRGSRVTVVTNNWMCELSWLGAASVSFDETMPFTGGTDTLFFRMATRCGARSAWSSNAVVYETIPVDRLTARYQFRRARAQSINHFFQKYPRVSALLIIRIVPVAVIRILLGVAVLVIPLRGLSSPIVGIRSIGWSLGQIDALRGRRINLYE